jgi:hypothetical protein
MQGFRFHSQAGPFYILPSQDCWEITFGNEMLGAFPCPEHAANHLASGHPETLDTSTFDIPDKIDGWDIVHI